LYPSVQINIDAGRLPPPHANGRSYLNIPISAPARYMDREPGWVAKRRDALALVDVREPPEFSDELGHIPGSQLVPIATLPQAAGSWDRDREIVVVCRSGARSERAALELANLGFRRVSNLRGGMLAWNAARLPVER
jgi:rhodanese-related sulfurtransferase